MNVVLKAEGFRTKVNKNEFGGLEWQEAFDRLIGRIYPGYGCEQISWASLGLWEGGNELYKRDLLTVHPARPVGGMTESLRDVVDVEIVIVSSSTASAAAALGKARAGKPAAVAASRENGKKGGRPRAYHLVGYVITSTGKLSRNGHAKVLADEMRKTILDAYNAGDIRRATVKAKRYWHGMKHDPELTSDEEAGLAEMLARNAKEEGK